MKTRLILLILLVIMALSVAGCTTPGSYEYHCGIHPFMTGRVIVV